MSGKSIIIDQIARVSEEGKEERLNFESGVNTLVGKPNTGKTTWLKMLDYLLGNDKKAEETFSEEVAMKYSALHMNIRIDGRAIEVERKWKERGAMGKVFVDGEGLPVNEYWAWLMGELGIPILHYPQGDPFGEKSWPSLNWRSLMRHIYRRQSSWSELASNQPESEQLACVLQFLGVAEHLFTEAYGNLIKSRKEILKLRILKEQYVSMLYQISKEIISEKEISVALTDPSIEAAMTRIRGELESLQKKRGEILVALDHTVERHGKEKGERIVDELGERLLQLQTERESSLKELEKIKSRLRELTEYRKVLERELSRLGRVRSAGKQFQSLRVTHCPACDQEIRQRDDVVDKCYVCGQSKPEQTVDARDHDKRIGFEVEQLQGEIKEAGDLIDTLGDDLRTKEAELRVIEENQVKIRSRLRPVQQAAAAVLPAEIGVSDVKTGELNERLRQLKRIKRALGDREAITEKIDGIQVKLESLEQEVDASQGKVDFESGGHRLAEGMNTYLNMIQQSREGSWDQGRVAIRLGRGKFAFRVREQKLGILGGTLKLYFWLSYHYSLMSLFGQEGFHYPGLAILDYPPTMEGTSVADKENFTLEPFVSLLNKSGMEECQVIGVGSSFANLEDVNRIELEHVWG